MAAKVLDGRYKLIKTLGAGGFGRTYIARDMRRPGNPVCVVKHLLPASDDPGFIREARRLFNTEAETLEKLGKHDQIPQLLAYFEENQQFFLVQEYIEGQSLYDELKPVEVGEPTDQTGAQTAQVAIATRDRQLTEPEVVNILKDVLGILEFVHTEGVIHRDLKPDNLIRRKKDGKLVLIDFGAVKAFQEAGTQLETSSGQSRFTVTIGTPGYMPSEQCAGRPAFSSDIYALGMIAIKALTGYSPTDLPSDVDTGEVIWRDRAKVSNGLAMVLTRMVRYHYTQRYQSAREALQGLAAFTIEAEPTPKVAASMVRSTGKPATRTVAKSQTKSESGSWLLFVGLFVVAGISFFSLSSMMRSNQKTPIVIAPTPINDPIKPAPPTTVATTPTPQGTPVPFPQNTPNPEPTSFRQSLAADLNRETLKEGKLKPNQTLIYTFSGQEGQRLRTDISGDGVAMTILGPDKNPVDSGAVGIATWDGKLTFTGDYELQVRTNSSKSESDYKLKALLTEDATRSIQVKPQ